MKTKLFFISAIFCLLISAGITQAQNASTGADSQALLTQIASLKQQITQILIVKIQTLTASLNKMTANSFARSAIANTAASPSVSPPPTIPPIIPPTPPISPSSTPGPTGNQGNNKSGGGSGGGGSNLPFGGKVNSTYFCDASDTWWIRLTPPTSDLPTDLIYRPGSSILYAYYQIMTAGSWILGTWSGEDECAEWDGYYRRTVKIADKIYMVGTSGGSDGQGSGGSSASPTPRPSTTPSPSPSTPPDQCKRLGDQAYTYSAKASGYYPDNSAMEGGFVDMRGAPLQTLQDYLAGRASYVSVAMDQHTFPYGTELCIPEIEQKYGKQIVFKVVDTGGAFTGHGTGKIDICVQNAQASYESTINGMVTLVSRTSSMK